MNQSSSQVVTGRQDAAAHPRLGVSSWSLNNAITRKDFTLLELPGLAAAHGFGKIEACHFHLPTLDPAYLAELNAACASAGVQLYTFLKDNGDITHPDPGQRDQEVADIRSAIDLAAEIGAARIRVIAGDAPPSEDSLRLSAEGLIKLADYGALMGVRVVTENWHRLLDSPGDVLALFEKTNGRIGLKMDFGNWPGERKYSDLPKIAPLAECTHAKAEFDDSGRMDINDFTRCLDIARDGGFSGPHILIFSSGGDEWEGLARMREIALPYVNA